MHKRNTLYTVNKWNRKLFLTGGLFNTSGMSLGDDDKQNSSTIQGANSSSNTVTTFGNYTGNSSYNNTRGTSTTSASTSSNTVVANPINQSRLSVPSYNNDVNSSGPNTLTTSILSDVTKSGDAIIPIIKDYYNKKGTTNTSTTTTNTPTDNSSLDVSTTSSDTTGSYSTSALDVANTEASSTSVLTPLASNLSSGVSSGLKTGVAVADTVKYLGSMDYWDDAANALSTGANAANTALQASDFAVSAADLASGLGEASEVASGVSQAASGLEGVSAGAGATGKAAGSASGAASTGSSMSSLGTAAAGAGISLAGAIAGKLIAGDKNTTAGTAIRTVGSTAGGIISAIPAVGWWVGPVVAAASQIIGGITDAGWGYHVYGKRNADAYQQTLNDYNPSTNGLSNAQLENYLADLRENTPDYNDYKVTYDDGWFTHKGRNRARAENAESLAAYNNLMERARKNVLNSAYNNNIDTAAQFLRSYSAYGGPLRAEDKQYLGSGIEEPPIAYSNTVPTMFTVKPKTEQNKTTMIPFNYGYRNPYTRVFANGGDLDGTLQAHGSNWSNVTQINAGGTHEENPHQGVQMGVDSQGTPNMVEEGEVVWNDYVFSNRIKVPDTVKKQCNLTGGGKNLTFADAAKELQKRQEETPNDAISKRGLNTMLNRLAESQEQVRQEMQAKEAQKAFAALPPEQQQAVMQQLAQEQAQQQQAQQQPMSEQEAAMQQQQQIAQQQQAAQQVAANPQMAQQAAEEEQAQAQAQAQEEANTQAYGGKVHRYDYGSWLAKYFPGKSYDEIAQSIVDYYNANHGDTLDDIKKEDVLGYLQNDSLPSWLYNAANQVYYADNPYAKNSGVQVVGNYTPYSTYNDLVIPTKASTSEHNPDRYLSLSESDYVNDAAYSELSEEQKKLNGQALAQALEGTNAYKAFTNYLNSNRSAYKKWVKQLADNGSTYAQSLLDSNGDIISYANIAHDLAILRQDGATNAHALSVAHFTPSLNTNYTKRYFRDNGDGTFSQITSPSDDLVAINTDPYSVTVGTNNYQDYYYKAKEAEKPKEEKKEEEEKKMVPKIDKSSFLRYAGALGPAVGLSMQLSGVGKPDYTGLDAAVASANTAPIKAAVTPIGDMLTYQPLDVNYEINRQNAKDLARLKALKNANLGPGLGQYILALDTQNQHSIGDLYRQAAEYNFNRKKDVAEFNRDTHKFNAEAHNTADLQYAKDYNDRKDKYASLSYEAAKAKMDADQKWWSGIYGNIGAITDGLAKIGQDAYNRNQFARSIADGAFPGITPDTHLGAQYVKYVTASDNNKKKKSKGFGGSINKRRRGLTY